MRRNQGVTIAALIIAIIGLSIGFAAFSNTLTIRSSASVNPTNTMRVVFSKSSSGEVTGEANSVLPDNATYGDGATIDNSESHNSILKDIHAKFTAPNQTVKYNTELYVVNVGNYQAQLTNITYKNITGELVSKKCTAVTENKQESEIATDSLVQQACNGISISVKIGNKVATPEDTSLNYQILDVGESLPVEVTITYANGSAYADGDFEVAFGDIEISATSAVDSTRVVTPSSPSSPSEPAASVSLIATAEDLEGLEDINGQYKIAEDKANYLGLKYYYEDSVELMVGQAAYVYAISNSFFENNFGLTGLDTNTWYATTDYETFTEYTGPSPISVETFANGTIYSQSYLNKVIASFSNNG